MVTTRRFEGRILGVGTTSGTRLVVGWWDRSPFGAFADVMVEDSTGRRTLVAPSHVADFVSSTYGFDDVVEAPVRVAWDGRDVLLDGGPAGLRAGVGRRTPLGGLLRAVPGSLATASWFSVLTDPVARVLLDGVRTRGSAGGGRRETYGATDVHAVLGVRATWEGADLGALADVDPPVRFGFGSTPRRPALTAVVTIVSG